MVVMMLAWTTGCEEAVQPNLGIDLPYTLWGIFNPKADTQAVRVFEIEENLMLVRPEPIDAVVTSTDLTLGEQRVWQDSLIRLADGDYRHVFWSAFRAVPGHTYRLEVARSDGARSSAQVKVPPLVTLEVLEPDAQQVRQARQTLAVQGAAPSLPRVDLTYFVISAHSGGSQAVQSEVVLSHDGQAVRRDSGWTLEVDFSNSFFFILGLLDLQDRPVDIIELLEVEAHIHVGDENWVSPAPGGRFDPDFLVEPGVFDNVENGFGFVGAGYVETIKWRPPDELLRHAGFRRVGE
ncbi:DUF4249 family protein [Rhodocaloribacter litoris]|uniref:DUF4249 family protein n=1 Tax=Rhodocaloribacter litoris TaxID=2558931 RepID=UPI00141E891B|nr:DUF4249 family protein [Rhodocaloribacter litoris]QXD16566.1 DUF4249 family protein [Rhodocaloribacter litoris]GIV59544.1 MAG: hypothetical protein KatS3mg043_0633 [Rhodothermaceae bacterium]